MPKSQGKDKEGFLALQLAPGQHLSWDPASNMAMLEHSNHRVELNATAYEILSRCDGSHRQEDIVKELTERYKHPKIEADTNTFVETALAEGWVLKVLVLLHD